MIMTLKTMEIDERNEVNLHELKDALLDYVCTDQKSFFKSQQIGDNDLTYTDKRNIAGELLEKSPAVFLQRFGVNIKAEHLRFFELQKFSDHQQDLVKEHLKHLCKNEGIVIKNRRYAALLELIKQKKYFSDNEMMAREPLLYENLIGQYLSAAEKLKSRRPNPKTDTLLDVLFQGIDRDYVKDLEKKQRDEESRLMEDSDGDESQEVPAANDDSTDSDSSNHKQWGNFESDEPGPSNCPKQKKRKFTNLITAAERDLLRDEFLGIMYSNFLSGKDAEYFDYTTVDSNETYDDITELERDAEDKYFEDDSNEVECNHKRITNEDSEDELDIYMKHLENHLKQQHQQEELEEFDD